MKKYIISSIIPNSPTDLDFLFSLSSMATDIDAELKLYFTKENYKKDFKSETFEDQIAQLGPFIAPPQSLNNNLKISSLQLNVNIIDPLSGLESFAAQEGCLILPFSRQRFKSVPRVLKEGHLPRAMWCTGTISEPYYKPTKSGYRMEPYHVKGALLVEVENDEIFHIHQLQFDGTGFYHKLKYYSPEGVRYDPTAVSAISMGDDHAVFQCSNAMKHTFKTIGELSPEGHELHVFRHDTLDCASISHHTVGKHLTRAKIDMTLEEELIITASVIKDMEVEFPHVIQHMVPSNHPEHLDRYIDEARYRDEPKNHILGAELAYQSAMGANLYEYSLNKYYDLNKVNFYTRKDTLKMHGIEMLCHGDEGSNGSRGNPKDVGIVYNGDVISGHTHSSEISVYNNFVNGTNTELNLPYTKDSGGSSWMNTNTILYKNGKRTHAHYVPGSSK